MKKYIDEYFEKQGIKVIYNTLGHTDELVNAYVKETYDMFANSKATYTNAIKGQIYNKFYSLQPREKKTGFEFLKTKDENFRRFVVPTSFSDNWNAPAHIFEIHKNDGESYHECLKRSLRKLDNPLVFYSGGIDSELVLQTFLDTGIKPAVAIFELFNEDGILINGYDLKYAYEFCKKNNLIPIVKKICPDTLWQQDDFIRLGRELRIGSPQILTHVWMAKIIADEFPNHTYCFGGEIRYKNSHKGTLGKTVLVNSAKAWNPSPSGVYTQSANAGVAQQMGMTTLLATAYWEMLSFNGTFPGGFAGPTSGLYSDQTKPPNFNYIFVFTWTQNTDDGGTLYGQAFDNGNGVPYYPDSNTSNGLNNHFGLAFTGPQASAGYVMDYNVVWDIYNGSLPPSGGTISSSYQMIVSVNP